MNDNAVKNVTAAGRKKDITFVRVLVWLVIALLLFVTLFPFYWVIRTSFTPASLIYSDAARLIPSRLTGMNYVRVLGFVSAEESLALGGSGQSVNFLVNLRNSLIIAVVTFGICMAGLRIGRVMGLRLAGRASALGGVILILIGIEIFVKGVL